MSVLLWSILAFPAPAPRDLDAVVRTSLERWQVPGLSVVIVHQGRVVYLKGFGVRNLGEAGAVGPETVFPLASCTKPFTGLALAMLADDGKIDWDDRVRKHLPYFRLKDPCADERVTLRDVLCHRTGLGRHDLLWFYSGMEPEDRLRRLALLEPDSEFRTAFNYQPALFAAAGYAGARAAGTTWDDLVRSRILQPLGMRRTTTVCPEVPDLAAPHLRKPDGKVVTIPRFAVTEPDPAGSLHTTARDLAAFLRLQLDGGRFEGAALVSARELDETHQTQMSIRRQGVARRFNPETVQLGYGLGWVVQDYRGHLLILHGGSINGFRAQITLAPEAGLGIALLNNLDGSMCNLALTNRLLDRFLDLEPRDWDGYFLEVRDQDEAARTEASKALRARRAPDGVPPLPLDAYAGDYADPAYGECRVRQRDGALHMSWGKLASPLQYVRDQTFLADAWPLHDAPFVFVVDAGGRVTGLQALDRVFLRKDPARP